MQFQIPEHWQLSVFGGVLKRPIKLLFRQQEAEAFVLDFSETLRTRPFLRSLQMYLAGILAYGVQCTMYGKGAGLHRFT